MEEVIDYTAKQVRDITSCNGEKALKERISLAYKAILEAASVGVYVCFLKTDDMYADKIKSHFEKLGYIVEIKENYKCGVNSLDTVYITFDCREH